MLEVIAISGKARHGKDTIAEIFKNELEARGKRVLIIHYGDLLKFLTKEIYGWDGAKDEKGRSLLQKVGTDIVRKKKPNFWVSFVLDVIELFKSEFDYILIPDARFENEIELPYHILSCKTDCKFTHIRIIRPNFDNGLTEEQKNHPSETVLDDFEGPPKTHYIINDSTLGDLNEKVVTILDYEFGFV